MVDANQGGELLERVTLMRRQTALTTGLVIPPIRIRDNMQLKPNEYILRIHGVEVGRGEAIADEFLAINPSPDATPLDGTRTKDPAFGFDAYWIPESQKPRAEALGYTCADATAVVATHLSVERDFARGRGGSHSGYGQDGRAPESAAEPAQGESFDPQPRGHT
jgi:flagellar biosynthesis protein FlhA